MAECSLHTQPHRKRYTVTVFFFYSYKWCPFYEALFGLEIFVEIYDSTFLSQVSSYF